MPKKKKANSGRGGGAPHKDCVQCHVFRPALVYGGHLEEGSAKECWCVGETGMSVPLPATAVTVPVASTALPAVTGFAFSVPSHILCGKLSL